MKLDFMNELSDSTFLVTGGAGFIGSNICSTLVNHNINVVCLDNLSTGKKENIESMMNSKYFKFIEGDITDYEICLESTKNVDFVLHQAAWGSVPRSIEMPQYYEEVNIKGTLNMLEASKKNKIKKFIYASSSSVYGDEQSLPKVEGREGRVLSPYALTKRVNEEYARLYTELYKLDTYGLRYFNVFGRYQNPNGAYAAVIPKFIKLLLENTSPIINGDGLQSRDFTYIDNVVEANLRACTASSIYAGQAFNIACGNQTSLLDVYNFLQKKLDKEISPVFGPERLGDIKHSNACIEKAKLEINYVPKVQFMEGIELALDWYKTNL